MVVATGAAIITVVNGGKDAVIGAGIGIGAGGAAAAKGTCTALGSATGVGLSGGAIAGAASGSPIGTVVGSIAGGTSALGVGGSGASIAAFIAGTGGWGLLAVGTSESSDGTKITYDCWKPVVHDTSEEPSNGLLLKDMVRHPHVAKVTMTGGSDSEYPNIVLENIWNERFEIEYLMFVETGQVACHARPILNCD